MAKDKLTIADMEALPLAYLVPRRVTEYIHLLRGSILPTDGELDTLERVLIYRIMYVLDTVTSLSTLRQELDDFRRLVPHNKRGELDSRRIHWSTKFKTQVDILDQVVGMGTRRKRLYTYRRWEVFNNARLRRES